LNLSVDDLRAKQRALERGLIDLRRHHKEGLILPEDFERNYKQAQDEIHDIRDEIKITQREKAEANRAKSPITNFFKKISKKEAKLKGTEEIAHDEAEEESKERVKRKKIIRRFAYRNGKQKK
jgi:hypothetical protein